ncbi:MAG: SRPBCC domain-containing protein [Bacteroidota bacterium]|nr:SRPBCC domain-containing protein [Bacteroidota bacterium]
MTTTNYTATLILDHSPKEVFDAITNVRGWWSEELKGNSSKLNDVFDYHFEDIHRCQMKLIEVIPDKKIVWLVTDNYFKPGIFGESPKDAKVNDNNADSRSEWIDTKVIFEISELGDQTQLNFTHDGLVPAFECYEACENGWNTYIRQSLSYLINTGKGMPNSTGKPMTVTEVKK